ncbi:MAG: hypothetical protein ABI407_14820, partial [Bradyrhizobium sp.]
AELNDPPRHALSVDSKGLQAADSANQKGRPMGFMVGEINLPGIADADQKLSSTGLLLCHDP